MSSRLTVPVSKFTRSISSTPSIARPSHLFNNGAKTTAVKASRKRQTKVAADGTAAEAAADPTRSHSTTTTATSSPHRPTVSPAAARKLPLMQGFRTSAPRPARLSSVPTLDTTVLPDLSAQDAAPDPYAYIRVPLLPDNHSPPAGARRPEALDAPLPRPEISVVAANPDSVLPSALTEVEGMGVDGVELKFAFDLHKEAEPEQGMVRDIWKGMMDDLFGKEKVAA